MNNYIIKKLIVIGLVITFLKLGTLTNIYSFSTNSRVIIVDDEGDGDFISIQSAIDNASEGDIIKVYSGVYNENLTIDKPIVLEGIDFEYESGIDNGKPIINANEVNSVIRVISSYVSIINFYITNSCYYESCGGIDLRYSHCLIMNNSISKVNTGIIHSQWDRICHNHTIQYNYIEQVEKDGINLRGSSDNIIQYNFIRYNNGDGLVLNSFSDNNVIFDNVISHNNGSGIYLLWSNKNLIDDNIIGSNIDNDIYLIVSQKNVITNNYMTTTSSPTASIYLDSNSSYNNIFNNDISNSHLSESIIINESNHNNIEDNSIGAGGIDLYLSMNNTIYHNTISGGGDYCINLMEKSNNNLIINNELFLGQDSSIKIKKSDNNLVKENDISYKVKNGIIIIEGNSNSIIRNSIKDGELGIYLETSRANMIIQNNFLNNDKHASFYNSFQTIWFNNYWDDSPAFIPRLIFGYRDTGGLIKHLWINIDIFPSLFEH